MRGWALILLVPVMAGTAMPGAAQICRMEGEGGYFEYPCPTGGDGGQEKENPWTGNVAQTIYAIVGLGASGGAAIFAWTRVRRRRRTLRETLDEVEQAYAASKTDPLPGIERLTGLRAELGARHRHGQVDDAHFLELDRRIATYLWRLRLVDLERRFPDLPVGLHGEIRHLVEDGALSSSDVERIERRARAFGVSASERGNLSEYLATWMGGEPEPRPRRRRIAVVRT